MKFSTVKQGAWRFLRRLYEVAEALFMIILLLLVVVVVFVTEWWSHVFSPATKVAWSNHLCRQSGGLLSEVVIEYYDAEGTLHGYEYINGEDGSRYEKASEGKKMPYFAWLRTQQRLRALA